MSIALERYASDFPHLNFTEPAPGVIQLMLSNPTRRNSVDADMHRELAYVWRTFDTDDAVRVVLARGAGEHFSSGGDLAMVQRMVEDEAMLLRVCKEASDLVYGMVNCSKPVVSAIRGTVVGAGLAVALLADISIAGRNARILDGHTRLGVAAGDHAVMIWPLLCGLAKARYYLLLNDPLSGEEAERIGLVGLCVDDEAVYDKALEVAQRLAEGSTTAVRWTKHSLNNWLRMAGPSFDASLAYEFLGFRLRDAREGVDAIASKRKPDFRSPE